jgi:hypothetical protein
LAVEQNNGGAILLKRKGGASYRIFVPPYRLHNRIAVDPQQNSYRFLTSLKPKRRYATYATSGARLGGWLPLERGAMRLLEALDMLKTLAGAHG